MKKITIEQAQALGYEIDHQAMIGYKGPRFGATDIVGLFTEIEANLAKSLKRVIAMHDAMFAKTDVANSFYDADTIREMNEAPLEARRLLKELGV